MPSFALYDAVCPQVRGRLVLARAEQAGSAEVGAEAAEALLRDSAEIASACGAKVLAVDAALDLSRVLHRKGRREAARATLAGALEQVPAECTYAVALAARQTLAELR